MEQFGNFGDMIANATLLFVFLAIWSVVWKGIALWVSARNNHSVWFIILCIVNTAGILEIIYIFAVGRKKQQVTAGS